jgi:hypothetical protein
MASRARALLIALPLLGASAPAAQRSETSAVREVVLEKPAGTRETWFRLDRPGASRGEPVGLVRWRVGPGSADGDGWTVESETLFVEEKTRLLHTEMLSPTARRLVWREVRHPSGRTLRVEWPGEGPLASYDQGGGAVLRRELEPGARAHFPLALIEVLRSSGGGGSYSVYQPLANGFEELVASVSDREGERAIELRRAGGDLAGRFLFRGEDWVEFQWQEGGPVATPIARAEYERLRARSGAGG